MNQWFKCYDSNGKFFIGQVSTLGHVLDQPAHLHDQCNINKETWFRLTEQGWVACGMPDTFSVIDMRDFMDRGTDPVMVAREIGKVG